MTESRAGEFNRKSLSAAGAATLGILFGPGPMIVGGLSLLMTAIAGELGWSRTTFSMMPPFMAWTAAATAPIYGKLMDRFGLRRVMIPAIAAFGVSFLLLAVWTQQIWQFVIAYFLVGAAAGALGPVGYSKLLAQWFTRKRGLVIALCAAAGSGVGYALVPQFINMLIENGGWRAAYVGTGLVILLVSLPGATLLLHERQQDVAQSSSHVHAHDSDAEGLSLAQGLRNPAFYILFAVLFLGGTAYYGVLLHLVPIITDNGLSRAAAATAVSFVAVGAIIGQLSASYLLDKVKGPKVALPFFIIGLAGILIVHHNVAQAAITMGAILIGFGQGAENSVIAYMTSRLLGLRAYGALYGLIYGGVNFASGLGPLLMGFDFDHAGSYNLTLTCFEGGLALAVALILFLRPYAFGGIRH